MIFDLIQFRFNLIFFVLPLIQLFFGPLNSFHSHLSFYFIPNFLAINFFLQLFLSLVFDFINLSFFLITIFFQ